MAETKAKTGKKGKQGISFDEFKHEILADYRLACESREASLLGRKEVLTGKAKFGIFGDGKELAQIALAKTFKNGDFRAGYYRDQTIMFAIGEATLQQFFAQLFAHPDIEADPFSAGRQMNAHFATRSLDENGEWRNLLEIKNASADASPTASQMARAVGLALASRMYRENRALDSNELFSNKGNEVTFCTIGDASTSEGLFWEAINAAGVMQIPLAVSIWDDGYGISVPKEYQTTKGSISEVLKGFKTDASGKGIDIYEVKGWDYPALCEAYEKGISQMRETHRPAIFHITEVTQPQGHSTSGSHERYKSPERLEWEKEFDCLTKMRSWIVESAVATAEEMDAIEQEAKKAVSEAKRNAWKAFTNPIKGMIRDLGEILLELAGTSAHSEELTQLKSELEKAIDPLRKDIVRTAKRALLITREEDSDARVKLLNMKNELAYDHYERYNTYLHSQSKRNALDVAEIPAQYDDDAPVLNGYEILNKGFDAILERNPTVFAFGEDLGKIGGVNQGFAGLQDKYGVERVFDTGIREATIMGQAMGMAMRGLRPIAEIQYLDYLIYGLQPLTDDLATLQYRTRGGQKAPMIIRTRGHRLEGIWHTGSPMGMIINSLRGVRILVPRNMTQAIGFYNTMLQSDEPALIIECLNGYRLKEKVPSNLAEFTLPLGIPEVLKEGEQISIVTYGSCVRIAEEAIQMLEEVGISCELIDVQSLLPFDVEHRIVESIKKTNRVVFLDEDVPGGASAYMMREVLEVQKGYYYLDAEPKTITAQPHRAAYGSDGDYFSKPNAEDVFETVYSMMNEADPERYPIFY